MDATTWTGTNSTGALTVSNLQFKPDFVWSKARSQAFNNQLTDSVRGVNKTLKSNATDAQDTTNISGAISSFNSNGFTATPGSSDNWYWNYNGGTFVGWCWQAGAGTTSTNTSGSITSTVSVNATAGFSVVTYTGNGTSGATVGHGLGVAPQFIITKSINQAQNWNCYHVSIGASAGIYLNLTQGQGNTTAYWNGVTPTSSVFTLGNSGETNSNGNLILAYCWAPVAGFSSFGSYVGNGSTDGPFVYTGFRPKFVMIKESTNGTSGDWIIQDTSMNTYNTANQYLLPNSTSSQGTDSVFDILSNGFKIRNTFPSWNNNGNSYIYMAFAENPFKYANAR